MDQGYQHCLCDVFYIYESRFHLCLDGGEKMVVITYPLPCTLKSYFHVQGLSIKVAFHCGESTFRIMFVCGICSLQLYIVNSKMLFDTLRIRLNS